MFTLRLGNTVTHLCDRDISAQDHSGPVCCRFVVPIGHYHQHVCACNRVPVMGSRHLQSCACCGFGNIGNEEQSSAYYIHILILSSPHCVCSSPEGSRERAERHPIMCAPCVGITAPKHVCFTPMYFW